MQFDILSEISEVETFAAGSAIRELVRLRKAYGRGRWRKRKGIALVRLPDDSVHLAELHWYEAHGIGKKEFKRKRYIPTRSRKSVATSRRFAVCVNSDGYEASLERNKIYVVLPDKDAERDGDVRVVDESGEDYLFSADRFVAIDVPAAVKALLLKAS